MKSRNYISSNISPKNEVGLILRQEGMEGGMSMDEDFDSGSAAVEGLLDEMEDAFG